MTDYQNPGSSGANVTWDFSASVATSNSVVSYITPNVNFPSTNMNQSTGGTTNQFIDMNTNGWFTYVFFFNVCNKRCKHSRAFQVTTVCIIPPGENLMRAAQYSSDPRLRTDRFF